MKETIFPTYNHCGYEFDVEETYCNGDMYFDDGDISDTKCPHCKKTIFIQTIVNYTFKAVDKDGEEIEA